jgi:hypothetical protein
MTIGVYSPSAYQAVASSEPHSAARLQAFVNNRDALSNIGANALFSKLSYGHKGVINRVLGDNKVILALRQTPKGLPNGKGAFGGLAELINRTEKGGQIITREVFESLPPSVQIELMDGFSKEAAIDDVMTDAVNTTTFVYLKPEQAARRTVLRELREETGRHDFHLRYDSLIPCLQGVDDFAYFMGYQHKEGAPVGADELPKGKPTVVRAYCYIYEATDREFADFETLKEGSDGEMSGVESVSLREALMAYGNPAPVDAPTVVGFKEAPRDAKKDFCYPHEYASVLGVLARSVRGDTKLFAKTLVQSQKERLKNGVARLSLTALMREIGSKNSPPLDDTGCLSLLADGLNNASGTENFTVESIQALDAQLARTRTFNLWNPWKKPRRWSAHGRGQGVICKND